MVTTVKSPELPGPETNGLGSLFVPFSTRIANEMITPQMLVEFFHQRFGDTNGPGTTVGVPLMFIPPRSGPRPASKAVLATP